MTTLAQETNDPLAERIREAWTDIKGGRARWINGTLKLAAAVADSRRQFPDHRAFSAWLKRNGLEEISPQNRSALNKFAEDLPYARTLLESSASASWEKIWSNRPNKPQRTLSPNRKGDNSRRGTRASGHRQRQRAARIPDVMQDKPLPLAVTILKGLTREEVDPDFKGTDLEYRTKYGHVTLHTKDEIKQDKRAAAAAKWVGEVTAHARTADAITARPEGVAEWLAKPGKAARLKALLASIRRAADLLEPEEQIATSPDLLTDECPDHPSLND